jgi:hypothetical protein
MDDGTRRPGPGHRLNRVNRLRERGRLTGSELGQKAPPGSVLRPILCRITPPMRITATYGWVREVTRRSRNVHPPQTGNSWMTGVPLESLTKVAGNRSDRAGAMREW